MNKRTPETPPVTGFSGGVNILTGVRRVERINHAVFDPSNDIPAVQWDMLRREYSDLFHLFNQGSLRDTLLASFTPLLLANFASDDVKNDFFTLQQEENMRLLTAAVEELEVTYVAGLPVLALIIRNCFPGLSFTMPEDQRNRVIQQLEEDTDYNYPDTKNILNRALLPLLYPEERYETNEKIKGSDNYWEALIRQRVDFIETNSEVNKYDVIIFAAAKLLGINVEEIDSFVKKHWNILNDLLQTTMIFDTQDYFPVVLFSLSVLAAAKVETNLEGRLVFIWEKKEEGSMGPLPVALEVTE